MARPLFTPGRGDIAAPEAVGGGQAVAAARALRPRGWRVPGPGLRVVLLLALGWLVQAGLRAWFARQQVMPLANPDETAYLISARVLAGGPGADLSGSTLYQGGYSLLITPVYWFTRDPATVYHAVMAINAAISAAVLPLGYLACRRLGLGRAAAYLVATVAALVPAGLFYSQYAMTDAIFPVLTLAWLLAVHSWLTARSARGRNAAAAGSALLSGYAYSVHSRGLVMLAAFAVLVAVLAWRRPALRASAAVAAAVGLGTAAAGFGLNHYLAATLYPEGTRSLSAQMRSTLTSVTGAEHVLEMAAGQLWRLVLDSWGMAGIGLAAAAAVAVRGGLRLLAPRAADALRGLGGVFARGDAALARVRDDLGIMAALTVAVTVITAVGAPAALPPDQALTWASGRYLDGMIIVFFLAGAAVLLRASRPAILACAAAVAGAFAISGFVVAVYAGASLPVIGFGAAFNFAEPAVLSQNWTVASVPLATAVVLVLLALWTGLAAAARRRPAGTAGPARPAGTAGPARPAGTARRAVRAVRAARALFAAGAACAAAVSLFAVAQMTSQVSRASTVQAAAVNIPVRAGQPGQPGGGYGGYGVRPGDQIAVDSGLTWEVWIPEVYQVYWTQLRFFTPGSQPPPAGTTVVETAWPSGQPAQAGWPHAPAGWRVVASRPSTSRIAGWVLWRKG